MKRKFFGMLLAAIIFAVPGNIEAKKKVRDIVFSHPHVKQMHGFYLIKEEKSMRFDIVVSFDAKDRYAVYRDVLADVQKAFPEYQLQVALDTDFAEE